VKRKKVQKCLPDTYKRKKKIVGEGQAMAQTEKSSEETHQFPKKTKEKQRVSA